MALCITWAIIAYVWHGKCCLERPPGEDIDGSVAFLVPTEQTRESSIDPLY